MPPDASPAEVPSFVVDVAPVASPELSKQFSCFVGFQYHPSIGRWSAQLKSRYIFLSPEVLQKLVAEIGVAELQCWMGELTPLIELLEQNQKHEIKP